MEQQKMERGLKPRHVEMIALGGTIGVGLFMGSANTIQMAGPSVLLCYAVTGVVMFFIMRIMGEMLYQEPVTGSFATYGHKYISPFVGYLTACSYWFLWVVVGLSEITAVGIYVHYWFPLLPQWISALAGMAIVAAANMAAVKYYGEFEFWFALIKVVTIIIMLIVGAAVILFGFGNGGVPVGISNLWDHGGFMPNGWGGMLAAMCVVAASFQGVELIGITAGEAQYPKHTLKKAVNNIVWRILIFYIGSIFVILCIYPWSEVSYIGSPFVMTFAKVGISAAAGIINFVVLTAALSGCNSGMFGPYALHAGTERTGSEDFCQIVAEWRAAQQHCRHHRRPGYRRHPQLPRAGLQIIPLLIQCLRFSGHGRLVRPGLCPEKFPQVLGTGNHGETSFQIAPLSLFQLLLHHLPDSRHYRHDLQP